MEGMCDAQSRRWEEALLGPSLGHRRRAGFVRRHAEPRLCQPGQLAASGHYCQEQIEGRVSHTLLRAGGWESSARWFSVAVLNITVLSCISTERHNSLPLQAPFVGLVA